MIVRFALQDGSTLVRALEKKKRGHVLIVGGGYLGMECAAALSGWEFGAFNCLFSLVEGVWIEETF